MMRPSPYPPGPGSGDPFYSGNFDMYENFSKIDDDDLARMRRFSNDGTVSQTVAGRTNDDYRPQAA